MKMIFAALVIPAVILTAVPAVRAARAGEDSKSEAAAKAETSMVREIRYDEKTQTLTVVMAKDGAEYEYYRVPAAVYREFMQSRSKGTFYLLRIKGQYEFKKKSGR